MRMGTPLLTIMSSMSSSLSRSITKVKSPRESRKGGKNSFST